ncbi:MAG TPA: hypothetical protein VKA95_06700 [Nitrososphaeraceae archaeon]|nr:hypothetical protein [Nitrososphaeraceae archaeon]
MDTFPRIIVSWEFRTTDAIDDIIGTQLLEFVIKQPSGLKSEWRALPEGELKWSNTRKKIKASLRGENLPEVENTFETFSTPLH